VTPNNERRLSRHGASAVLGRGGLAMNAICLGAAVMFVTFAALTALSDFNSTRDAALDGLFLGFLMSGNLLAASMSIRGEGREVVLVSVVRTTTIPVEQFIGATGENGLEITTVSGERVGHIGYGGSLIGLMTGHRRSTEVARRITQWFREVDPVAPSTVMHPVRRQARRAALVGLPGGSLLLAGIASAVRAVAF
jgi:hypothetical protein